MNDNYKINLTELDSHFKKMKGKRIVVLGDLMLDHYLWGSVDRISPEAPVPVVDIQKEEYRLGGAANVVHNLLMMEATPLVIGVIGDDRCSGEFINKMFENKISTDFITRDSTRSTTVKTRVYASGQQVMRYDIENRHDISKNIEKFIMDRINLALQKADAMIIEDYNKGLLTPRIIQYAIKTANKLDVPITIDPKVKNFFSYKNCTVFKPNLVEVQKNLNIEIRSDIELLEAAHELFKRIKPEYLIITLGEKGMMIFTRENEIVQIPTFAKEVFDVCGAGDTVISVLTLCMAIGLDIKTSAIIANHAAGAVCGKRGIHPVTKEDIRLSVKYNNFMAVNQE